MIEITTEKVIVRGVPHRRIKNVVALEREQLPTNYLENGWRCYMVRDSPWPYLRIMMPSYETACEHLTIGNVYKEEWFQKLLQMVKQCGDRLHEINKEIAELKKTWVGDEAFLI